MKDTIKKPVRRGHNEGNIRRRSDGRWEVRLSAGIDYKTGEVKRTSTCCNTRQEAIAILQQQAHEVRTQGWRDPMSVTLGEWYEYWLDTYMKDAVKQSTYASYRSYLNKHFCVLGKILLKKLEPHTLQEFYNYKFREEGVSPKTLRNYYQPAELAKIKAAFDAESPKWRMLGYLCMIYGDRRSEFAGIKRSCIDFGTHSILLLGTVLYHPRRGAYEKPYPKNEKGRLLPMSPEVETMLKGYLAWLDVEKGKWGDQWSDTDYIFCGEHGGIINPDTITKHFAYMTKKWQKIDPTFPHVNPHAFRHTVVSLLLHNGVDKISVADFVGDDPATLDRYYAHLINDGRVQAANAMNSIMGFAAAEMPAE